MPNINTANFTLSYGTTKRTFGDRLQDRYITVLDFGADPTGGTDSTTAIQAALDYSYGTAVAPHGSPDLSNAVYTFHTGDLKYTNKPIFFPAGDYKVSSMLRINVGYGVSLIGAGSHQTRIFWDGDPEPVPEGEDETGRFAVTALLTFYMCWGSRIEGITLDAGDAQEACLRTHHWPPTADAADGDTGDDGSRGYYRDVCFANATSAGFISTSAKMGSERAFYNCRFLNNTTYGIRMLGANVLNYNAMGCHFEGSQYGINAESAGHVTVNGCTFANNSVFDLLIQYGGSRVVNCSSTSQHFAFLDGLLIANRHINGSVGFFYTSYDLNRAVLIGNYSSNGIIQNCAGLYLKANDFDNADYLDTPMASGSTWIFEDGVMVKEP